MPKLLIFYIIQLSILLNSVKMQAGKLYLIPSPISESKTDDQLFAYLIPIINELDVFFVENLRCEGFKNAANFSNFDLSDSFSF